ncbi:RlpA-like double-psi beta-barrel-protein domain-containing protein-containing protein [Gorgonomyces haynaldii]|nr:RlpA-like double-psi beta-barrel-protein domain-containing protein-containing protein [Gorgonomyces haynaldii]
MTYYDAGLGACGNTNTNSDLIVAVSASLFDVLGNGLCGQKLCISMGGKQLEVMIQDKCPGCSMGSLDGTPAVFQHFANLDVGRMSTSWSLGPCQSQTAVSRVASPSVASKTSTTVISKATPKPLGGACRKKLVQ